MSLQRLVKVLHVSDWGPLRSEPFYPGRLAHGHGAVSNHGRVVRKFFDHSHDHKHMKILRLELQSHLTEQVGLCWTSSLVDSPNTSMPTLSVMVAVVCSAGLLLCSPRCSGKMHTCQKRQNIQSDVIRDGRLSYAVYANADSYGQRPGLDLYLLLRSCKPQ